MVHAMRTLAFVIVLAGCGEYLGDPDCTSGSATARAACCKPLAGSDCAAAPGCQLSVSVDDTHQGAGAPPCKEPNGVANADVSSCVATTIVDAPSTDACSGLDASACHTREDCSSVTVQACKYDGSYVTSYGCRAE